MAKKTYADTTASEVPTPDTRVALLDGRIIEIDFFGVNHVKSDIQDHKLDFSWAAPESSLHTTAITILRGMLSTHSLSYVEICTRYVGALLSDAQSALNDENGGTIGSRPVEVIALKHCDDWPRRYGVNSWAHVQAVLGRWRKSGLPGLSAEVKEFLRQPEKFEQKGNGAYFTLVVNDPRRGAFTEQELRNTRDSVNRAFEEGVITITEWALVWFLIATGVRPVQIARTLMSDVIVSPGPEGTEITLAIPLAKGENGVVGDRWKRKAPTVLTEVLIDYLVLPANRCKAPDAPLFEGTSNQISRTIASIFRRVDTYSERLKGPIPIFPYRFRYTLGTRAIALGARDHEVARLLTHRQTVCIHYYRRAMPGLQKPIKEAVGEELSFLALAFQGRLIGSLEEATRRGEAGALIRDFAHLVGQRLGACGTRAECHQNAPRACLTCRKFEPFRDAPWEQFLGVLKDDLAAESEDRIRLITQEQIEAVREIMAERDASHRVAPQ